MKGLTVINAFVDRRSGKTIRPGDPIPGGLSGETVHRLMRARCLAAAGKSAVPRVPQGGKRARKAPTKQTAPAKTGTENPT